MENLFHTSLETPVGWLKIITNKEVLISVRFISEKEKVSTFQPDVLKNTCQQLNEYFEGKRRTFNIPVAPGGTEFQKYVWQKVMNVPYGQTASYGMIARETGSIKNARAVGLANAKNPIPIIIPCHRILSSSGKLTGYAGGLENKRWLLLHEAIHFTVPGLLF
jgi:methylated-DNA-[protein]-cysteine S-methyltransferase